MPDHSVQYIMRKHSIGSLKSDATDLLLHCAAQAAVLGGDYRGKPAPTPTAAALGAWLTRWLDFKRALLLHHKCIDFRQALFHNIFIVLFNTQRLQSALTERRPRAVRERTSWKHGGRSLSIFPTIKLRVPH